MEEERDSICDIADLAAPLDPGVTTGYQLLDKLVASEGFSTVRTIIECYGKATGDDNVEGTEAIERLAKFANVFAKHVTGLLETSLGCEPGTLVASVRAIDASSEGGGALHDDTRELLETQNCQVHEAVSVEVGETSHGGPAATASSSSSSGKQGLGSSSRQRRGSMRSRIGRVVSFSKGNKLGHNNAGGGGKGGKEKTRRGASMECPSVLWLPPQGNSSYSPPEWLRAKVVLALPAQTVRDHAAAAADSTDTTTGLAAPVPLPQQQQQQQQQQPPPVTFQQPATIKIFAPARARAPKIGFTAADISSVRQTSSSVAQNSLTLVLREAKTGEEANGRGGQLDAEDQELRHVLAFKSDALCIQWLKYLTEVTELAQQIRRNKQKADQSKARAEKKKQEAEAVAAAATATPPPPPPVVSRHPAIESEQESELRRLRASVQDSEENKRRAQAKIKRFQERIGALNETIRNLEVSEAAALAACDQVSKECAHMAAKLEALGAFEGADSLGNDGSDRSGAHDASSSTSSAEKDSTQRQFRKLSKQVALLQSEKEQLRERVLELELELDEKQGEIDEKQYESQAAQMKIQKLTEMLRHDAASSASSTMERVRRASLAGAGNEEAVAASGDISVRTSRIRADKRGLVFGDLNPPGSVRVSAGTEEVVSEGESETSIMNEHVEEEESDYFVQVEQLSGGNGAGTDDAALVSPPLPPLSKDRLRALNQLLQDSSTDEGEPEVPPPVAPRGNTLTAVSSNSNSSTSRNRDLPSFADRGSSRNFSGRRGSTGGILDTGPVEESGSSTHIGIKSHTLSAGTRLDDPEFVSESWFHGRMGRDGSAQLLINYGDTGAFLVRESSNQPGQYVLSVNWHGIPRHMRLMTDLGGCRISNLTFDSVCEAITHFETTPFPIDSRMISDNPQPLTLSFGISRDLNEREARRVLIAQARQARRVAAEAEALRMRERNAAQDFPPPVAPRRGENLYHIT